MPKHIYAEYFFFGEPNNPYVCVCTHFWIDSCFIRTIVFAIQSIFRSFSLFHFECYAGSIGLNGLKHVYHPLSPRPPFVNAPKKKPFAVCIGILRQKNFSRLILPPFVVRSIESKWRVRCGGGGGGEDVRTFVGLRIGCNSRFQLQQINNCEERLPSEAMISRQFVICNFAI